MNERVPNKNAPEEEDRITPTTEPRPSALSRGPTRSSSTGLAPMQSSINTLRAMAPHDQQEDLEEGRINPQKRKKTGQLKDDLQYSDEERSIRRERFTSDAAKSSKVQYPETGQKSTHYPVDSSTSKHGPEGHVGGKGEAFASLEATTEPGNKDFLPAESCQGEGSKQSLGLIPGAHRVIGIDGSSVDGATTAAETTLGTSTTFSSPENTPDAPIDGLPVRAKLVEPGEVVEAQEIEEKPKRGFAALPLKCRIFLIGIILLLLAGLVTGLVVGLRAPAPPPELVTSMPTISPSDVPSFTPTFVTLRPSFAATWTQLGGDLAAGATEDKFGGMVAFSGNASLVVVSGRDSTNGTVYVFRNTEDTWNQLGTTLTGGTLGAKFGSAVAFSNDGSILAVGARQDSTNASQAGQVRVFRLLDEDWVPHGTTINGRGEKDRIGRAVSLSADGMILALGSNGGKYVSVYGYQDQDWVQIGEDIPGDAESVSLSQNGTVVAIGDDNEDEVRVFRLVNLTWAMIGSPIRSSSTTRDFGRASSLSSDGMTVAVGDYRQNFAAVYRLERNSIWTQLGTDIRGVNGGDRFGYAVSLSGDGTVLAVGATENDANNITNTGHVRIYRFLNEVWSPVGYPIDGSAEGGEFGQTVAISADGKVVAAGSPENGGYVQIYRIDE